MLPVIEALEPRVLLSTFHVNTFDDVIDPNDGLTSLREAIIAANDQAGEDKIVLPAGEYKLSITGWGGGRHGSSDGGKGADGDETGLGGSFHTIKLNAIEATGITDCGVTYDHFGKWMKLQDTRWTETPTQTPENFPVVLV